MSVAITAVHLRNTAADPARVEVLVEVEVLGHREWRRILSEPVPYDGGILSHIVEERGIEQAPRAGFSEELT